MATSVDDYDAVVVGAGGAGLFAALELGPVYPAKTSGKYRFDDRGSPLNRERFNILRRRQEPPQRR